LHGENLIRPECKRREIPFLKRIAEDKEFNVVQVK
jgi:hypothetical protein